MQARAIRIDGDIAYVPLTQGYTATIDAADVSLVDGVNWRALAKPLAHAVYAVRTDRSGGKTRAILLHRVIMGDPEGLEIDHRNGDGLNNRRANLREATRAQNRRNQRLSRANTSGFKGVSFDGRRSKWQAYININDKQRNLGLYATPEAAHAAYCAASAKLHGEFGRTA
jgi:hypothetical protein